MGAVTGFRRSYHATMSVAVFVLAALPSTSSLPDPGTGGDTGSNAPTGSKPANSLMRSPSWLEAETLASGVGLRSVSPVDSPFVPVLAADDLGKMHLFLCAGVTNPRSKGVPPEIRHKILDQAVWTDLPEVPGEGGIIWAMKAVAKKGGGVYLLWHEDSILGPAYRPPKIYLRGWDPHDGWTGVDTVTDQKAEPWHELDLLVDKRGGLDAFWIDWREDHALISLFTGEGQFAKTFHRRRTETGWGPAEKVQRGGKFRVLQFDAVRDKDEALHLLWTEMTNSFSKHGYSGIFHSIYENGRWGKPVALLEQRNFDGTPAMDLGLNAALGADGKIYAFTIFSRSVSEALEEHPLRLLAVDGGSLREGPVLSKRANDALWVAGPEGPKGIILQEHRIGDDLLRGQLDHSLYYVPVSGLEAGEKQLIAENVASGLFDAAVDKNGVCHLVYVQVGPENTFKLVHRKGR